MPDFSKFHIAKTDIGGQLAIVDEQGRVCNTMITEEAMANQFQKLDDPIMRGLLYKGTTGLVVAPPKAGKSNLTFMMANHLAQGTDYLGYEVLKKCAVYFVEYEENGVTMANRYGRMPDETVFAEDGELVIERTPSSFMMLPSPTGAPVLNEENGLAFQIRLWDEVVASRRFPDRPKVIFIDTLARSLPNMGSGNYSTELNTLGAVSLFAERYDYTIVYIHHTNKGSHDDAMDAISGTNGILGSVAWALTLKRETGDDGDRLQVGSLTGSNRNSSENDMKRYLKLSDNGFWELDTEREDEMALKARLNRDRAVDAVVKKVVRFMAQRDKWMGTAADLLKAMKVDDIAPQSLARKLNRNSNWLLEHGIAYTNERTSRKRTLYLSKFATDKTQDAQPESDYDLGERKVAAWLSFNLDAAAADSFTDAIRVLADTTTSRDAKYLAMQTVEKINKALTDKGLSALDHTAILKGDWPDVSAEEMAKKESEQAIPVGTLDKLVDKTEQEWQQHNGDFNAQMSVINGRLDGSGAAKDKQLEAWLSDYVHEDAKVYVHALQMLRSPHPAVDERKAAMALIIAINELVKSKGGQMPPLPNLLAYDYSPIVK